MYNELVKEKKPNVKSDQYTAEEWPWYHLMRPCRTIYENDIHTAAVPFSNHEMSQNRVRRLALKWYTEVFTVVQYVDQMCIMNVHNHEVIDSEFLFYEFRMPTGGCIPLGCNIVKSHKITVPGGPVTHNFFFYFILI